MYRAFLPPASHEVGKRSLHRWLKKWQPRVSEKNQVELLLEPGQLATEYIVYFSSGSAGSAGLNYELHMRMKEQDIYSSRHPHLRPIKPWATPKQPPPRPSGC